MSLNINYHTRTYKNTAVSTYHISLKCVTLGLMPVLSPPRPPKTHRKGAPERSGIVSIWCPPRPVGDREGGERKEEERRREKERRGEKIREKKKRSEDNHSCKGKYNRKDGMAGSAKECSLYTSSRTN